MTIIDNTKQLPWTPVRAHLVKDENTDETQALETIKTFDKFKSWLFKQTPTTWYLFVESEKE
jgi:hypothetical protein